MKINSRSNDKSTGIMEILVLLINHHFAACLYTLKSAAQVQVRQLLQRQRMSSQRRLTLSGASRWSFRIIPDETI